MKLLFTITLSLLSSYVFSQTTLYKVPSSKELLKKEQLEFHRDEVEDRFGMRMNYKAVEEKVTGDTTILSLSYNFSGLWRLKDDFEVDYSQDNLIGQTIPFTSLKRLDGSELKLEDLKGKPTVMNFWFTSCAPCIQEMPALNRIKNQFKDQVNFIAVTHNSSKKVREFLKKREFNFDHVVDARKFITKGLFIDGMPEIIFLDKDGEIIAFKGGIHGEKAEKRMINEIQNLIDQATL
ncbi:TlpA family protein disulfide reductase [Sediminitomix flava]|uniref:Thiol-disulfide isomerase/thioredoxin n=1 Tax=Sediminitomix flava TaxID=379075 RepID=A0A315ZA93_SEDFL|nr:TlpA disulfide reductase family protein [Sediminitomix flava]PWJ42506.1 thiol-disulfide isomerase/thioredoxin [Sediminitomix flava]